MKYNGVEVDLSWIKEFFMSLFYTQTEDGFYVKRWFSKGEKYCQRCFKRLRKRPHSTTLMCDICGTLHNNPDYTPAPKKPVNWKTL